MLHLDSTTKVPVYEHDASKVAHAYQPTNMDDASWYYNYMIRENMPHLVISGEFDYQCGVHGQTNWMKELLNVSDDYWKKDR